MRIGIIGAGKRVHNIYLPILRALKDRFDIVGFTTRKSSTAKALIDNNPDIKGFSSVSKLVEEGLDFILVCVSANAVSQVGIRALELGVPLLVETPITDPKFVEASIKSGLQVGVVEQWPYLPLEQFKELVFVSGVMARPFLVQNDCRTYDYHAIAQMRTYLGRENTPVSAQGQSIVVGMPEFKNLRGGVVRNNDAWDIGSVRFSNGALLLHQFAYNCKTAPFRTIQSLRSYSQNGSILTGKIHDKFNDYEILDFAALRGVETADLNIGVDRDDNGRTIGIREYVTGVKWENPFAHADFDDGQIAMATHLQAIGEGRSLYPPQQAFLDSAILSGLKQACATNGTVRFAEA